MFNWKNVPEGTIVWSQANFESDYNNLVYSLISQLEGMKSTPYWDGDETSQVRFPTIGKGVLSRFQSTSKQRLAV